MPQATLNDDARGRAGGRGGKTGGGQYAVYRRCPASPSSRQVSRVQQRVAGLGLHTPLSERQTTHAELGNSSNSSCSVCISQGSSNDTESSTLTPADSVHVQLKTSRAGTCQPCSKGKASPTTLHFSCPAPEACYSNSAPRSASARIKAGLSSLLHRPLSIKLIHSPSTVTNNSISFSSHILSNLHVSKVKASLDKKPTLLDEKSNAVLKYRTPFYRASGSIEVPALTEGQAIQVGWIQTCTDMWFLNAYGREGVTSWEFPELQSGKYKMVSDADGKQYPWYGAKTEMQELRGPAPPQAVNVHMNDNFFPQVTWHIPDGTHDKTARLTQVHRQQRFVSFLAAKDLVTGGFAILKTVVWAMEVNIKVNPQAPLGKRACLLPHGSSGSICQPRVLSDNPINLDPNATCPPNANSCQALVWRPVSGLPKIVVAPIHSALCIRDYLKQTAKLTDRIVKIMAAKAQLR